MNWSLKLVELILAGFFAVACLRACVPASSDGKLNFRDFFRFPGRLDRLQRSRWQWFSMVALLLVLRLQGQLPIALELIVGAEFLIFLAVPVGVKPAAGSPRRGNAAAVGHR